MPGRSLPNGLQTRKWESYIYRKNKMVHATTIPVADYSLPMTAGSQTSIVYSNQKGVYETPLPSTLIEKKLNTANDGDSFLDSTNTQTPDFATAVYM